MADNSLIRINHKAPALKKKRMPSRRKKRSLDDGPETTVADVQQYNLRQLMKCVETRSRWRGETERPGPPGMRRATTVSRIEVAQRSLPPIELAAYMAKEHGTQEHQNQLVDQMETIINVAARRLKWRVYNKAGQETDPIKLLASIVVEEWLDPSLYWVLREDDDGNPVPKPKTSVFCDVMGLKRDNWSATWMPRFLEFQGWPQKWYDVGKLRMGEEA